MIYNINPEALRCKRLISVESTSLTDMSLSIYLFIIRGNPMSQF